MLRLPKKRASHEDLFLERYPELMSWSLRLLSNDRNRAEDLVHDAYIQWMLVKPELSILNIDGYLYGILRNMHSAEKRRAFRAPQTSLSVVEYDSALLSLHRANDEAQTVHMQDQLRIVCAYACIRKETSKSGSLFLLRFFHGYYPSETARLAGIKRVTVDSWLRIARAEAKLYLENPEALKLLKENPKPPRSLLVPKNEWEFFDEITNQIFRSCRSECLTGKKLNQLYSSTSPEALAGETLAHISSCENCLMKAAKILDLPSNDDRCPPDHLRRDPEPGENSLRKRKNSGNRPTHRKFRMRMEDVVEHRPKELHVSVNGFTVGTQKVISERIEHSLKLSLLEQIGLVEVLSEQGIRLLALYVEPPPEGQLEQSACVSLSDERTLKLNLNFHDQWPTLELTYSDPHFAEVTADPESLSADAEASTLDGESRLPAPRGISSWSLVTLAKMIRFDRSFWSRPTTVTALVLVLLAITSLLIHKSSPAPVAADVLARAQTAEQALVVGQSEVIHRNISFEERKQGTPGVRHRVEIWQNPDGNTARRLYDEAGALVAGAWQNGPGASQKVFYHHGSKLKVSPPSETKDALLAEHVWLLDPSAKAFSIVVRGLDSATIETTGRNYVLTYRRGLVPTDKPYLPTLAQATLTIDRASLHAISETLTFDKAGERTDFLFTELSFERLSKNDVSERVFQPDPELLVPVEQPISSIPATAPTTRPLIGPITHPPTAAELGALEVNVLSLLDQINANSGEQIEVRRLPGRELLVEAIVDTDKRKKEILQALSSVATNRLVRMDVVTLEEALKRDTSTRRMPQTLDLVVSASDRIPVYDEVHRYFERQKSTRNDRSPTDIETEIRRFSSRMVDESRQGILHAFALKNLVDRFSPNDLRLLDEESRRKWHGMIRTHARAFRESSAALRRDLDPIFAHSNASQPSDHLDEITDDAELIEAVKSLVRYATATDDAISSAFSISPDPRPMINTPASAIFWRTLSRAESLAAALERIQ